MKYRIYGLEDPYTFEAPNLMTAGVVSALMHNGQYSLHPEDDGEGVPSFTEASFDNWWAARRATGESGELPSAGEYIAANKDEIVEALRSVKLFEREEPHGMVDLADIARTAAEVLEATR